MGTATRVAACALLVGLYGGQGVALMRDAAPLPPDPPASESADAPAPESADAPAGSGALDAVLIPRDAPDVAASESLASGMGPARLYDPGALVWAEILTRDFSFTPFDPAWGEYPLTWVNHAQRATGRTSHRANDPRTQGGRGDPGHVSAPDTRHAPGEQEPFEPEVPPRHLHLTLAPTSVGAYRHFEGYGPISKATAAFAPSGSSGRGGGGRSHAGHASSGASRR